MLKKIGKIGLALVLILGLLPIMSLRAYAAVPSFNETTDFVIEPPVTYSAGKNLSAAQGLPDGSTAVLLNSFVYEGNTYVSSNFLRIFDNTGMLITDINLSSLMDTYYKMTDVNMLVLNNGNLLITYNKSDSGENNLQLGTVTESTPNTYFMVLDKAGHKVTTQTQINTFSDASLPQLTRFVSATELSDGNIAFSWQRNDNVSTATRVFTVGGTPVSSETLLVKYNASMSYVSAGDGVYMVAYNSGASADYIYLKIFSNSGTLLRTIDVGARTNEKQLYLSTLNNGNFMFSQYYWVNDRSTVSLYDNEGNSQGGFEVNGYLGEASAAVYKDGAQPGFVTVSTDPISNAAINDAYNYGTEWSGTQYAYLNYYDYDGNLVLTSDQPVDSAPVVFQGYDEDSWMFDVEYYPKFALYPAFADKVVLIKTDNTDATHYRIIGKLFDTEPSTPVALLSATADGVAGTTTSTKIDLTFDTAIAGLTADDITITDGTGSAVKGTLSGSGTDWSIGLTSVTTEGDVSVAVNSPSGYTISGSPMTVTVSLFTALPEATPAAEIDYAAEQLTGLTANGAYTLNGTLAVTATVDGKLAIDSSWLGTPLSIVKKGNGSTTIDSVAQTVSIPSRPAAPIGVAAMDETAIDAEDGTLTGVTTAMEYKIGIAGTWLGVSGTTVTGLAPDTYYVRTKATPATFVSEAQSVTVAAFVPTQEATPVAEIDYAAEQLKSLAANGSYTVNGTLAVTATANGQLAIDSSWLGTPLSIVKKGNGSTTIDSVAQTVSIPVRPAAPTGVLGTDETAISAEDGTLTGVTTAMEYKIGIAGTWLGVSGTTVTGLAPDTYYVRTKATPATFVSEAQSVTVAAFVPTQEATPVAEIDYAAEQLTGLAASGSYTINGTLAVTATADGKLAIDSSWLGTSLSIVKKGNGSTTIDSAAQTVSIPVRPAAPTGVAATEETAIGAEDGTLTGVTTAMEYKKGIAGTWLGITGTSATGLAPDTYYVRTKASSMAFASEAQSVTIVAFVATPEATPAADIDYAAEQLTGLTANGAYTLNGTLAVTATADGKLAIDSSWLGTSLSIVKKGNGSTTIDSAAQTVNIPSRPAAPTGVAATDETAIDAKNGTLTGVTTAMEYKKGTAGEWTDVAGTTVTALVPDTYYVRTKATLAAFVSEEQSVTVAAFVPTQEATPAAEIDYASEQLTGLTANGAYTLNGTLAVMATADGKLAIDSSWLGTSLSIVKKGNGSTTIDSAAQTVSIPVRPAAPAGVTVTDETALNANNGTLTNVTTAMEYKKGTAGAWTDVPGTTVTALVPDTYYVRTKATATTFTSASVQLTVLSFTATPEATPAAEIDYAAEQLRGLTPDASYTVNGIPVTAAADGNLAIDSSWLGSLLDIVKKGNASTTTDSAVQTLTLPARPAAPVGVSVTDVTYNGANDGTLQNLTVQMEYKTGSAGLWTDVTDTIITGLAPDTYYVREKATSTAFASNIAQVTVHDSDAVIPAAPEVAADDQNNTIVGLDTSMEFAVDDGTFIRYDGTNLPDLSGEHTVEVRVAASGSVPAGPATTLTFTINELIPAGGLSVSASDPSGAGNNGYTQISVTPEPAAGHKLLYKNFGTGSVVAPNAGEILTGYTLVGIDGLIPAANGDRIGIAEVDADGKVVKYGSATAVVVAANTVTPDPDPVIPGTGTSTGSAASNVTDVIVLVNGKEENAGKATTTTSGNLKITTIAVDPAKLQAKLDAEGNGAVVSIPMMLDSNIIIAELNGQMIKNMENVSATLVLQTIKGTYTLPASEINIGALAERLGNGMKLEDITLRITIGETSASMNQVVTAAAGRGGFTLVAPPIDFTVTATYGTLTVEVSRSNAYVERTVALPDGIDPNRITTGIVVDPDGTVRHVPTRFVRKDGRYYADIKSLTNSSYAVVWHPLTFADVDNHWAKNAVNDMGSRLVINGVNETTFNPNADITRAEFAAIIVRGLGLKLAEGTSAFADVAADSWYAAAVETASEYGLITGFEDGAFRPDARITREQAMSIIAKAIKLTGLAEQTGTVDTASVLAAFTDAGSIGAWAGDSLALAAKAGLITGRGDSKLEAKANVTRAEVAVLIQRLLQKSDLID
ncbi:S-layer homology domain-containing protein [Paenibacillus sp. FSL E2-0178]|uniref:S-layer homology domain-containing protein n=1 Tax=Paenibacillus sp. FSL E2-0178 TaxID=2921361 RepID=UPI003158D6B0